MKKTLISSLVLASTLFANNYAGLQLTNDTLSLYVQTKLTQNNIYARAGYLYNDNKNKNNFYFVGIKGEGNLIGIDVPNLKVSLLLDFVGTKNNSALPIGIGLFGYIPNFNLPVFVKTEAAYAPQVLSFKDANRFSRVDVSLGIQPIENSELFIGYRNISFNHNYDSSFYGGIGYHF